MSPSQATSTCPHKDAACGVYYTCSPCKDKRRRKIYAQMSEEDKAYDRMVDPAQAYHTDYHDIDRGCSCHINPPCSYCIEQSEEAGDE